MSSKLNSTKQKVSSFVKRNKKKIAIVAAGVSAGILLGAGIAIHRKNKSDREKKLEDELNEFLEKELQMELIQPVQSVVPKQEILYKYDASAKNKNVDTGPKVISAPQKKIPYTRDTSVRKKDIDISEKNININDFLTTSPISPVKSSTFLDKMSSPVEKQKTTSTSPLRISPPGSPIQAPLKLNRPRKSKSISVNIFVPKNDYNKPDIYKTRYSKVHKSFRNPKKRDSI